MSIPNHWWLYEAKVKEAQALSEPASKSGISNAQWAKARKIHAEKMAKKREK